MSDRRSLEDQSLRITEKYFKMQEEMTRSSIPGPVSPKLSANAFFYVRVSEISSNWLADERPLWQTTSKFFVGLFAAGVPVSVVLNSDGVKTDVFVGTLGDKFDVLKTMLKGSFPQLRWQEEAPDPGEDRRTKKNRTDGSQPKPFYYRETSPSMPCGGYLKGNPTGSDNVAAPFQMDSVIKGMKGKCWNVSMFAFPILKARTLERQQYWLGEATACSELKDVSFSTSDNNLETVSYKKNYHHSAQYCEKVEAFCEKMTDCLSMGE